ncbi:ABC transporter [Bifidobacterium leontopitheci]|uniref:ABC transporter n=2 Tax=Bifidobacterium leontopitheci TaxID=2650774 RepID=A0A6I1GUV3_9BIFI|nr:ABC transporter [Bifidobacterium leontopitheci]
MTRIPLLFAAEIRRYLAEVSRYVSGYISSLIVSGIVIAMLALSSEARTDPSYWIGFLLWTTSSTLISESSVSISSDKQDGTFTQLMLRPTSLLTQITVKALTWVVVSTVVDTAFILLLFALLHVPMGMSLGAVPVALLTLVALFGFTMVLAGVTVVYTKTASFADMLGYAMMFLSGVIVPLASLPTPLAWIGRCLPITLGTQMARDYILGRPVSLVEWLALAVQVVVYLALGYVLFTLILRYGRKHGINMRY